MVPFLIMAGACALIELVTEMLIASAAHRLSAWLARVGRSFSRACGGVFVSIGALLPVRA